MALINTISKWDTVYTADCIEFCPINKFNSTFAVGTYQLEEGSKRIGQLNIFKGTENLTPNQQIDTSGIFDLKWCPYEVDNSGVLGIVNAEGTLKIYNYEENLSELINIKISDNMLLYLDWAKLRSSNPFISVSDSGGYIRIISLDGSDARIKETIEAHKFETWVTRFNNYNSSIVYSGADDNLLKGFDTRTNKPIFSIKEHTAGVTSIEQSNWTEYHLFSGCYDGCLNSWDTRNMTNPISKSKFEGGVWRLKCEPFGKPLILASLMHDGFKLIKMDGNFNSTILAQYDEHNSLAYGADWCRIMNGNKYTIGSVSFYDHLLCLWQIEIKENA